MLGAFQAVLQASVAEVWGRELCPLGPHDVPTAACQQQVWNMVMLVALPVVLWMC